MAKLFDFTIKNGAAGGFGMFSAAHFAWLAALLAAGGGVCLAYKKADENSRRVIRRAAAWGALGMELLRAALLFAAGEYNLGRLPLHLCAMAVYICALHAWRGGALTGQFLYAFCMPGAVFAAVGVCTRAVNTGRWRLVRPFFCSPASSPPRTRSWPPWGPHWPRGGSR